MHEKVTRMKEREQDFDRRNENGRSVEGISGDQSRDRLPSEAEEREKAIEMPFAVSLSSASHRILILSPLVSCLVR